MQQPVRLPILLLAVASACANPGDPQPDAPAPATAEAVLALSAPEDCDDLRARFVDSVADAVLHARYGGVLIDDKVGGKGDDTDVPDELTREIASEPPPVEEEDIVKRVGDRLFVLDDGRFTIVEVAADGALTQVGNLTLGPDLVAEGAFVDDARAVLVSSIVDAGGDADFLGTRVTLVDLADPAQPTVAMHFDVEGAFTLARRVGDEFYLATTSLLRVPAKVWDIAYTDVPDLPAPEPNATADRQAELRASARQAVTAMVDGQIGKADDVIPRVIVGDAPAAPVVACADVLAPSPAATVRLTTLLRFDEQGELRSTAIAGDAVAAHVAPGAFFGAFADRWGAFAGQSRIHQLALEPTATSHAASALVDGTAVDRFSITASDDVLHLITTHDDRGAAVHTLDIQRGELSPRPDPAQLGGSELVVANRLTHDRAFVATSAEEQRIYAVNLADADVVGPFDVGGIATMIHTLEAGQIFVVAQQVNGDGDQVGVSLELFDDAEQPTAVQAIATGEFSAWSEAMWDPRSLAYASTLGLVAFPVNVAAWADNGGEDFSGALVYRTEAGMDRVGMIDHRDMQRTRWCRENGQGDDCAAPPGTAWWTHVRRTLFVDDAIITISDAGVKSHRASDLAELGALIFE